MAFHVITFHRYRELADEGGVDALINRSRRAPNLKNRIDDATERAVVDYAVEFPAHGQHRTSNELRKPSAEATLGNPPNRLRLALRCSPQVDLLFLSRVFIKYRTVIQMDELLQAWLFTLYAIFQR